MRFDAGHHREVVAAGEQPGERAAPLHADRLGDRLALAHVDEHAERPVAERAHAARAERRGDVARHAPALAERVLAGRRARRARASSPGRAPRRRRRSPTRSPGPRRASSRRPRSGRASSSGSPSALDDRMRPDARRPHARARRDDLAVAQARRRRRQLLERRLRADLDAAAAQLARGELRERRRDLGHHAVGRLDEDPAHPLRAAARVEARSRRRRSPAARRGPRAPRSPRRRRRRSATPARSAGSSSVSAASSVRSRRLRSSIASGSVLKPIACSARPGTGSVREIEPERDDELVVAELLGAALERLDA